MVRDIRRAHANILATLMLSKLALHIPVPLVDLGLFQAKALLQLDNFGLLPDRTLLEFDKKDFILLLILTESLLGFLVSLDAMTDHDSWHRWR